MAKYLLPVVLLIFCSIAFPLSSATSSAFSIQDRVDPDINIIDPYRIEVVEDLAISTNGTSVTLSWTPAIGAIAYKVYSSDTADGEYGEDLTGVFSGDSWTAPVSATRHFYYVTAIDNAIPENFVFVEGGTIYPAEGIFTSGLTVSDFYIDKYELTNADWEAVMGSGGGNSYPHAYVSWYGAIGYCNRRSMQEDLTPCYSYLDYGTDPDNWPSGWDTDYQNHENVSCDFNASGYRLPTEAEWEYAARGGLYTHSYTYSGSDNIYDVCWFATNSGYAVHPVGQLAPNELGTYDMSGNIREWVWDMFDGSNRVLRGGDYLLYTCDVAWRNGNWAIRSYVNWGFRVCRNSP